MVAMLCIPTVRAGLTVDLHIYRNDFDHAAYAWLSTNNVPPAPPLGDYLIQSPHYPTNGTHLRYSHTPGSFIFLGGGDSGAENFDSFINSLTNGPWSIQVTNATSTNTYTFNVTTPGLSSNVINSVSITYPMWGDTNVPVNPTFTWEGGPIGWQGTLDVEVYDEPFTYYEYETISPTETSWNSPTPLLVGANEFYMAYRSNATATIIASTPVDGSLNPISGWVSTANIEITDLVSFTTQNTVPLSDAEGLVAHYRFDNPVLLGTDSSTNGYDLNAGGSWNGGDVFDSTDAVAGAGAVEFYTDGGNGGGFLSYDPTPAGLLSVLSTNFSISLWLKTSQSFGNSGDYAFNGAGVVSADIPGLDYDVLPVALTEGEVAFNTGGDVDYTINSTTNIYDGQYHHVVVTRDQTTGAKKIYIDGALNISDFDSGDVLDSPVLVTLGGIMDASVSEPGSAGPYNGYEGLMDDLQIYSKVLSAPEVAYLFNNPGNVATPDAITNTPSVGHTNIGHYRFDLGNGLGYDSSPAGNHFNGSSSWDLPIHSQSTPAAAGDRAVLFTGNSSLAVFSGNTTFTNLQSVLADSCSVSLWLQTTNTVGSNNDDAVNGASILWLYNDQSSTNGIIPVAVTGNKVAFYTGDELGNGDTLHSTGNVTDGNYHHIVVTRDRATGQKRIYVDGVLDATGNGSMNLLNGNNVSLSIGGTSFSSFTGLVDDVQIYSGVLSASEVTNLFNNPGTVVPDTDGNTNPPVNVAMEISFVRNQDLNNGDIFYCLPKLLSVNVPENTEHRVESPNSVFTGSLTGSGYDTQYSLASLLNECTNGQWTLYINKNDPSVQVYKFNVVISGVDTNFWKAVTILSPTNGSLNVPVNPTFTWDGPVGFNGIFVKKFEPPNNNVVITNMPGVATNWPSPPTLNPGANGLYLSYHTNNCPNVTFTTPLDSVFSQPIHGWSATAHFNSDGTSEFVVSSLPSPVQLLSAQQAGTNCQFQFLSESGRTNTVQSRTNLSAGSWQNRTNILGDGTLKTVLLPIGPSPTEFFRMLTQ